MFFPNKYSALEPVSEPISVNGKTHKADFINKLSIALKEADETQYWLEILYESGLIVQDLFNPLNEELKEIITIITSSIKTAKEKGRK